MARPKRGEAPPAEPPKATGTAVVAWDEELAKAAMEDSKMEESAAGGTFFSLQGGQLSFGGQPIPENRMVAIVANHILENVYYEGDFDPNDPRPPTCYAFGRDEAEMQPHDEVYEAELDQAESCAVCDHNKWGSSDKGRGKACRNTRRLALLPAGSVNAAGQFAPETNPEVLSRMSLGIMKLPVTSVKGWATYVQQITNVMKRPVWAVYTKISIVPDRKTQFKVMFEPAGLVPNELLGVMRGKREEADVLLDQPYPKPEEEDAAPPTPPPPAAGKRGGKGAGAPAQPAPAAQPAAGGRGRKTAAKY